MSHAPVGPEAEIAGRASQVAPATLEGWYVLHQLFRLDWGALREAVGAPDDPRIVEVQALLDDWADVSGGGWSGAYRMVGAGVDLMLLHFRADLDGLMAAGRRVSLAGLSDFLRLDHEYLSVVELGLYGLTAKVANLVDPADHEAFRGALDDALAEEREKAFVQRRLYPRQPDDQPYVCYYPMDKRRDPGQNWYTLPLEERAAMMSAHGTVGRRYAGRITQVIGGSIGLADWEWAVTLWSADPLSFKSIITDMRFDVASAEYAEFGQFYVGKRLGSAELPDLLTPGTG